MKPTLTFLLERTGNPDSESELLLVIFLLLVALLSLSALESSEDPDPESELLLLVLVLDLTFVLTHSASDQAAPRIPTNCPRAPIRMAAACQPDAEMSARECPVVVPSILSSSPQQGFDQFFGADESFSPSQSVALGQVSP